MSTATEELSTREAARSKTTGTMQVVGFRLANEEYGIEISKVREIILPGQITRIPETPHYVKGLINLRSTVIPVIDLRVRFGMPEAEASDGRRIMVVNVGGKTVGIVVDEVSEVLRISEGQIAPPPPTVADMSKEYLIGLARLEDRLLILLDIDRILGQDAIQQTATTEAV